MMLNQISDFYSHVNCYSKDSNGAYIFINPAQAVCFQVTRAEDILGMNDKSLVCQAGHAERLIQNDKYIIQTGLSQAFFETGPYNGKSNYYRSFKTPILGRGQKILGIQGMSIPVSEFSLIPLTKQQTACLKFLALGNTHKQIGQALGLSQKTVEHYLDAVKLKLNCRTRSDLVLQAIERGLVGVF